MASTSHPAGSFLDAIALLDSLREEEFSGSFRAENEGVVKVLYISEGRLACASSTHPGDRLGNLLVEEGKVTADELETALDKALPGEALGSVLVNLGTIEPDDLLWGARKQVERVVASILTWKEGAFRTRSGPLPDRAVNLKLDMGPVLLAAAGATAGDVVPGETDETGSRVLQARSVPFRDQLSPETAELLDLLDGRRDLAAVEEASVLPAATVRVLVAVLGALDLAGDAAGDAGPAGEQPEALLEGVAEPAEAAGALPFEAAESDGAPPPDRRPPGGDAALPAQAGRDEIHALDEGEDDLDDEAARRPGGGAAGIPPASRPALRGWVLGGALPLAALLLVFVFAGGEPPPALDTTAAARGAQDGTAPGSRPAAEPDPAPANAPTAEPPPGPSPPAPSPLPPTVAIAPAKARLETEPAGETGLAAFRAGEFSRAADLWRRERAGGQGRFTLQVLVACRADTLRRMRDRIPDAGEISLARVVVEGETCFKVLWGTYDSLAEAQAGLEAVPAFFTRGGERPWPIPLSSLP